MHFKRWSKKVLRGWWVSFIFKTDNYKSSKPQVSQSDSDKICIPRDPQYILSDFQIEFK